MTRTRISATFPDGHTVTRRTREVYVYAARNSRGHVSFHHTHSAAYKAAGMGGTTAEVVEHRPVAATCVVCDGTGTVTYGPSAVDGSYDTVPCHRCNA